MEIVRVGLDERGYEILIDEDLLSSLGGRCRELGLGAQAAVVTNTVVGPLYARRVADSLRESGFIVYEVEIPDGEEYKNLETLDRIYGALIKAGLNRSSFLVALGGGVTGDVTGFAAATFLRGIPFVQVPTTLLAQVDSSVGGKTGVNHKLGKNLIGAFYQPSLVIIDVSTLDTLSDRDYRAGLAEVVKYGVALDRPFFDFLAAHRRELCARDKRLLAEVVRRSCELKAAIVEQDERESGLRAVLNYGHTIGHAVETLAGYGTYLHGEAVSIGMVQAARISQSLGFASADDTRLVTELLADLGLPVELPKFTAAEYEQVLLRDKKMQDAGLNFVCNKGIGEFVFSRISNVRELLRTCGLEG